MELYYACFPQSRASPWTRNLILPLNEMMVRSHIFLGERGYSVWDFAHGTCSCWPFKFPSHHNQVINTNLALLALVQAHQLLCILKNSSNLDLLGLFFQLSKHLQNKFIYISLKQIAMPLTCCFWEIY